MAVVVFILVGGCGDSSDGFGVHFIVLSDLRRCVAIPLMFYLVLLRRNVKNETSGDNCQQEDEKKEKWES